MARCRSKERRSRAVQKVRSTINNSRKKVRNVTNLVKQQLETQGLAPTVKNVNSARRQIYRPPNLHHDNCKLDHSQELLLVAVLLGLFDPSAPMNKADICKIAEILFKDDFGRSWCEEFLDRQRAFIKLRTCKVSEKQRSDSILLPDTKHFANVWRRELERFHFRAGNILNIDETKASSDAFGSEDRRLAPAWLTELAITKYKRTKLYTTVACIAASGRVELLVHIYKGSRDQSTFKHISVTIPMQQKETRHQCLLYYASTSGGFMTKPLWIQLLDVIIARMDGRRENGNPVAILFDGSSTHRDTDLCYRMLKKDYHPYVFPPHSSHVLQPLDGAPFAQLKNETRSAMADVSVATSFHLAQPIDRDADAALMAEQRAFTPEVIQSGFRARGIFPFDRALMIKNVQAALGRNKPMAPAEDAKIVADLRRTVNTIKDSSIVPLTKQVPMRQPHTLVTAKIKSKRTRPPRRKSNA
jgi:hypothetical protein